MKQHITIEQLNELDDRLQKKLSVLWKPKPYNLYIDDAHFGIEIMQPYDLKKYYQSDSLGITPWKKFRRYPLLSIGQMIEFLSTDCIRIYNFEFKGIINYKVQIQAEYLEEEWRSKFEFTGSSLCDTLWEAVKYTLSETNIDKNK